MDHIKKLFATKEMKLCLTTVGIIAVLTSAFLFQKSPNKQAATNDVLTLALENVSQTGKASANTEKSEQGSASRIQTTGASATPQTPAQSSKSNPEISSTQKSRDISQEYSSKASTSNKNKNSVASAGKQKPAESENITLNDNKQLSCTLSIRCDTILSNIALFNKDKLSALPSNGIVLKSRAVSFSEGESVFDILKRITREERIHMEFVNTPIYNSAYIKGINNIYEFDCGDLSGWMYKVNGWFPNYGCSRYFLEENDVVEFLYTCDLGKDIGGDYALGQ